VEFEVDQNLVGRAWRVSLFRGGRQLFTGVFTTRAPSGSFEARRVVANRPGADTIAARARALRSGERCSGLATARF
jgi:hypothetical protein